MVQEQKKRPTLDLDAEMGGATEVGPQATGPSVGESNQDRLAELGMARRANATKDEVKAAEAAASANGPAASNLDGLGDVFRASADWAMQARGGDNAELPMVQKVSGSTPVALYDADIARYTSFGVRADRLAAEDQVARATHDDTMREADVLDRIAGTDLGEVASVDAGTLDRGLDATGALAPARPTAGPALEEVRTKALRVSLAPQDAAAELTRAQQRAQLLKAKAAGAKVKEIETFIEDVDGFLGFAKTMAGMPFAAPEKLVEEAGKKASALITPKAFMQLWFSEDVADLKAEISRLTGAAAQLGLVSDDLDVGSALEDLALSWEELGAARSAAEAAVSADQQAWQQIGVASDTAARASGDLAAGEEQAVGAAIRFAKIDEVGQRLDASRKGLEPTAGRMDLFAAEVGFFAQQGGFLSDLTKQRRSHEPSAQLLRDAAQGLRVRLAEENERLARVAAARAVVAGVRAEHAA